VEPLISIFHETSDSVKTENAISSKSLASSSFLQPLFQTPFSQIPVLNKPLPILDVSV
jgi:hypothetical protein